MGKDVQSDKNEGWEEIEGEKALGLMGRDAAEMAKVWEVEMGRISELWGVRVGKPSAIVPFNMLTEIEAKVGMGLWKQTRASIGKKAYDESKRECGRCRRWGMWAVRKAAPSKLQSKDRGGRES